MLANAWCRVILLGGIAFGMWISAFMNILVHPIASFMLAYPIFFYVMYRTANLRGTDGWNKKDE